MLDAVAAVHAEAPSAPIAGTVDEEFLPWTADAAVPELLALCVIDPPLVERRRKIYVITVDEWRVFRSEAADRLTAIYASYGDKALQHLLETGDNLPFRAWAFDHPSVTDVIDQVLVAAGKQVVEIVVDQ